MTREEAISILKRSNLNNIAVRTGFEDLFDQRDEAFSLAIKALEQESVLDKIRTEITNIHLTDTDGHNNNWYRDPQAIITDVLAIIDRHKAESEGKK